MQVADALETIKGRIAGDMVQVVGVDGVQGVGKSTLARRLANECGLCLVSLDDFLNPDQNRYVDALRIGEAQSACRAVLDAGARLVVEGLCLLEVLDRIGIRADILIYLRRCSPTGRWEDEQDFTWQGTEEDLVARITDRALRGRTLLAGRFGSTTTRPPALKIEVARYHLRRRPHEHADLSVEIGAD